MRQLSNRQHYETSTVKLFDQSNKKIKSYLSNCVTNGLIPPSTHLQLTTKSPRLTTLYLLPKIHKANNPGRPIISACGGPTEKISSFVDHILKPHVVALPSLANYVNLCSDSDSDHELYEPARKYPRHSLSAETTPSITPSTLPTDSPCPLPAALMEPTPTTSTRQTVANPTPSTSTMREWVPSRWDTPLLNPSPNYVEASPFRINTSRQPTGPSQRSFSAPPVINMDNGLPPLPPRNALNLLTDYQSSSSAKPTPEKFPSDTLPPTHHTASPSPSSRPLLIDPAHVTPTRQEPIQVSLNEAVDLLNELRTICDTLLPGHG